MTLKMLLLVFSWFIFLSFWTVSFFVYRDPGPKKYDRNWFLLLISIIPIAFISVYLSIKYLLVSFDLPIPLIYLANMFGFILILSGLLFAIWARTTLGRFWSGSVALLENHLIINKGPYAFVRHPIYAGVIAMLWGSFLLERIGFVLVISAIGTVFLIWKARLEESLLEKYRGEEYVAYKMKVRGIF